MILCLSVKLYDRSKSNQLQSYLCCLEKCVDIHWILSTSHELCFTCIFLFVSTYHYGIFMKNKGYFTFLLYLTWVFFALQLFEIIGFVYQYLKLMRQISPPEWIFKELQDIGNMDFRFAEEQPLIISRWGQAPALCRLPFADHLACW